MVLCEMYHARQSPRPVLIKSLQKLSFIGRISQYFPAREVCDWSVLTKLSLCMGLVPKANRFSIRTGGSSLHHFVDYSTTVGNLLEICRSIRPALVSLALSCILYFKLLFLFFTTAFPPTFWSTLMLMLPTGCAADFLRTKAVSTASLRNVFPEIAQRRGDSVGLLSFTIIVRSRYCNAIQPCQLNTQHSKIER